MDVFAPLTTGLSNFADDNPAVFAEALRKENTNALSREIYDEIERLERQSDQERAADYDAHLIKAAQTLASQGASFLTIRTQLSTLMVALLLAHINNPVEMVYQDLRTRIFAIFPGGQGQFAIERLDELFIGGGKTYLIDLAERIKTAVG